MLSIRALLLMLLVFFAFPKFAFAFGRTEVTFQRSELRRCEPSQKRRINQELNRIYDKAFPVYFEFCAGSIWNRRGINDGGNYGHAFGIIRGACLEKDAEGKIHTPQQLVPCPGRTVGFSTDSALLNHQWIAVEGREFILFGEHDPARPLDQTAFDHISDEAAARGLFEGVAIRPEMERKITEDARAFDLDHRAYRNRWIGNYMFGTEFAIAAARGGVTCTRVPLTSTKPGMKPLLAMLTELNNLNRIAYKSTKIAMPGSIEPNGFDYDDFVNNCVHTPINAMAALGAWGRKNNTGHPVTPMEILVRSQDVIAPFNQVLDTYLLGKEMKPAQIENMIMRLRANRDDFAQFKENGWYATQVGTMIDNIPALTYMNSLFNPSDQSNFLSLSAFLRGQVRDVLFNLASPLIDLRKFVFPIDQPLKNQFNRYINDEAGPAMNLIANLEAWQVDYGRTLSYLRALPAIEQDDVVKEVISYVEAKLKETSLLLRYSQQLWPNESGASCIE
jgi:hypothetical protein